MYEANTGSEGAFGPLAFLFLIVLYVFFTYCHYRIANKTGEDNAWFAFIPILNTILLIQQAQKSMLWFLFLLIPVVNIICFAILWAEVAKRVGYSPIVGVLTLFPLIQFITLPMMAFGSGSAPVPPSRPTQPRQPQQVG